MLALCVPVTPGQVPKETPLPRSLRRPDLRPSSPGLELRFFCSLQLGVRSRPRLTTFGLTTPGVRLCRWMPVGKLPGLLLQRLAQPNRRVDLQ